ncbi:hypothetical protein D3C72_1789580 [compost metagenome]
MGALLADDGNRYDVACCNLRQCRADHADHRFHFAADHGSQGGARALVGDMGQLDAGLVGNHLHREVRRIADARATEGDGTGLCFGLVDKRGQGADPAVLADHQHKG